MQFLDKKANDICLRGDNVRKGRNHGKKNIRREERWI